MQAEASDPGLKPDAGTRAQCATFDGDGQAVGQQVTKPGIACLEPLEF